MILLGVDQNMRTHCLSQMCFITILRSIPIKGSLQSAVREGGRRVQQQAAGACPVPD